MVSNTAWRYTKCTMQPNVGHKATSIKIWQAKVEGEESECPSKSPDLNSTERIWDELEDWLHTGPPHPTSMSDHTNAFVAEWSQVTRAAKKKSEQQNLHKTFIKCERYYTCKEETQSEMRCLTSTWPVGVHKPLAISSLLDPYLCKLITGPKLNVC